jgi:hypothetical protein
MFQVIEPSLRQTELFEPFAKIDAQAAVLLVKLARLNGALHRPQLRVQQKYITKFDLLRKSDLLSLNEWFSPWPSGFTSKLMDIESEGKKISWELLGTKVFPKIHAFIKSISIERRRMPRPGKKYRDDPVVGSEVSLKIFLQRTNTTYDRFMYWLEMGWLQGVYVTKKGLNSQQFHIPAEEYFGVLDLMNRTSSTKEIMNGFHVSRASLKALVESNVLEGIYMNRAKYVFRVRTSQLTELVRKILTAAKFHLPKSVKPMAIDAAILHLSRRKRPLVMDFIQSICSGDIQTFIPKVASKQWDNLVLDQNDLQQWISTINHRES